MGRSSVALVAFVLLAGCHLADSPDPIKCDPGTHPSDGHCVLDPIMATTVTISAGEGGLGCSVDPSSITVTTSAQFEFKNTDAVDHGIAGVDGQTWTTVKAGQLSPLVNITKAGSYAYTVSGCAKGGTVIVE
jgi:hypothetical protein